MDDDGLPNARPIAVSDSPRCQRSQSSVFSAAVKPPKYPRPIAVHSFPFQDRVLRRPVETTTQSGHDSGKRPLLVCSNLLGFNLSWRHFGLSPLEPWLTFGGENAAKDCP